MRSLAAYLSAQEAADELGISLPTLYSYVSRGLIRSETANEARRTRRYSREDVEHLKSRKLQRRDPVKTVEEALHWGAPVMESAITLISDGHLFYRGCDALELARTHPVEAVAALIWTGDLSSDLPLLRQPASLSARLATVLTHVTDLPPLEQFQLLLPLAAVEDMAAYDLRPTAVVQTGAKILQLLVTIAAGGRTQPGRMAERLQQHWIPDDLQATDLLSAALILCADHELNVSSFTARCVASAGATPYQAVTGGLAALQGVKHGRSTERVDALLQEVAVPDRAREVIGGRLKRGEAGLGWGLPGFGHQLYPGGDPRGRLLFSLVESTYPSAPGLELALAVASQAESLLGEFPNIDFGLVVLARALNLPAGAPITLFALGRTIGWIGHVIEQYAADRIIRPRARYVGDTPVKR
ncbi:MAG TPA: citrate synthase family protein [Anaerolineae bacterium]|nr:citrate synthase family protein [Anaerolineae bacterium]